MREYPWTTLKCTGNAVGLPEGTQGGSEPGHLTMGAGRVVWQPLEEINRAIRDCSFYQKKPFTDTVEYLKKTGGRLHLAGLFSDQGIHGTIHHLHALLELAKRNSMKMSLFTVSLMAGMCPRGAPLISSTRPST